MRFRMHRKGVDKEAEVCHMIEAKEARDLVLRNSREAEARERGTFQLMRHLDEQLELPHHGSSISTAKDHNAGGDTNLEMRINEDPIDEGYASLSGTGIGSNRSVCQFLTSGLRNNAQLRSIIDRSALRMYNCLRRLHGFPRTDGQLKPFYSEQRSQDSRCLHVRVLSKEAQKVRISRRARVPPSHRISVELANTSIQRT